jgi:hypothetical protein
VEEVRLTPAPQARHSVGIRINLFHLLGICNSMTKAGESGNPYALAKSTRERERVSANSPQVTPPPRGCLWLKSFVRVYPEIWQKIATMKMKRRIKRLRQVSHFFLT